MWPIKTHKLEEKRTGKVLGNLLKGDILRDTATMEAKPKSSWQWDTPMVFFICYWFEEGQ